MDRTTRRLRSLARKWGGDLILTSESEFKACEKDPGFFRAPFTKEMAGVHWVRRHVIFGPDAKWPTLIHEMGHAFACLASPDRANEEDFLGWEVALVRFIKADMKVWLNDNQTYQVSNDGESLGSLTPKARQKYLSKRRSVAKKLGLLNSRWKPVPVTRTFDVPGIQAHMTRIFEAHRRTDANTTSVISGAEFERRVRGEAWVEGYHQCLRDLDAILFLSKPAPKPKFERL